MGGPPTPGVGWAAGVDRLAMLIEPEARYEIDAVIMPMSESANALALLAAKGFRSKGKVAVFDNSGNLKKRFARADKLGAKYAVIIGENEVASHSMTIKDLKTGEQMTNKIDKGAPS